MKKYNKIIILFTISILLYSCADSVDINECVETKYGFLYGIWHGIITPISFIVSLFNDDVVIYAVNNTGGWYDFGFLIGICSYKTSRRSKEDE